MKFEIRFLLLVPILFIDGCESFVLPDEEFYVSSGTYDAPFVSSSDVLERAYQMASMEWEPIKPVPKRGGGYYEPGKIVVGVPYSSVKEINSFLFQDVSYHTFMTAIHNPYSVVYTENISEKPYHGENCAPYYGSVCSSSVMWALGIRIPYASGQIIVQPFMKRLEHQEIDSLRVCDVLWKNGHVQMVFDIEHRSDTLYKISLFEQSGSRAHISTYLKRSFLDLWNGGPYEAYRYQFINYSDNRSSPFDCFEQIDFNDDLCPSKGDKAVYRTDDPVVINIFNSEYNEIVLKKDDAMVLSSIYNGGVYVFTGLDPGIYYCYLQTSNMKSKTVSFEIIKTEVDVELASNGNPLIHFNSNALPDYVAISDINGNSEYYPISESERLRGYIVVPRSRHSEYYCKVIFKGRFGTITNKPVRVR